MSGHGKKRGSVSVAHRIETCVCLNVYRDGCDISYPALSFSRILSFSRDWRALRATEPDDSA